LDTPGHEDFSEDTYRTLMAVDSAVMVIDAAKGIEPQTLKLFKVCKMRGIPIFTFINKLDRVGKEPFELLEEIESTLEIETYPIDRKSTRLNSSHVSISYAVFCLKKKNNMTDRQQTKSCNYATCILLHSQRK